MIYIDNQINYIVTIVKTEYDRTTNGKKTKYLTWDKNYTYSYVQFAYQ